jgi:hypothetical protein
MVVEQHPTLLNVTLHPAKVGHGLKAKNQTGHRRRTRPPKPFSAQPLWRESIIPPGDGGSSGHGVNNSSGSNSSADNVAGDGVRLVGSGGDRGEIGHSDGDGGGELALTENYMKGQDTPRIQQWLPVEPYTYYSPGHHEITDSPFHNSNDDALHMRVAHDTLEDWHKAMRSGSMEAKSLIQILYFAAPLFSFQVLL